MKENIEYKLLNVKEVKQLKKEKNYHELGAEVSGIARGAEGPFDDLAGANISFVLQDRTGFLYVTTHEDNCNTAQELLSLLKTSSETNTPVTVRGSLLLLQGYEMNAHSVTLEEYVIEI